MAIQIFNKWLSKLKPYLFKYKKGFYELPYIGNSPTSVVAYFNTLPFVKHDKQKGSLKANNPFLNAGVRYFELEPGLWTFFVNIDYKKNVKYIPYYHDSISDNFYMLSLNEVKTNYKFKMETEGGKYVLDKLYWTLFKPLNYITYMNNKNSTGRCVNIYFNRAWLEDKLEKNPHFKNKKLEDFISSQKSYLIFPELNNTILENHLEFESYLKDDFTTHKLREVTNKIIDSFLEVYNHSYFKDAYYELHEKDREVLFKVEKFLLENLFNDFPGIEELAKKFHISETKIKKDFKLFFGKSIFQFYQEKRMQLAKQLLDSNKFIIGDVAIKLGYQNPSKFSYAFKSVNGILPSEVTQK